MDGLGDGGDGWGGLGGGGRGVAEGFEFAAVVEPDAVEVVLGVGG